MEEQGEALVHGCCGRDGYDYITNRVASLQAGMVAGGVAAF